MTTAKPWTSGLLGIALSALLLAAPARAIVSTGTPTALHGETDGDAEADRQAVSREIERFRSSSISISQAMAIAESRHAGATTADVSFDGASGVPVYRVKTLHNDRIWRHTINAATGGLVGGEAALPLAELDLSTTAATSQRSVPSNTALRMPCTSPNVRPPARRSAAGWCAKAAG
ncbi:putative membrane protein YkoI [Bradyrhizobium sp. LM6.10]